MHRLKHRVPGQVLDLAVFDPDELKRRLGAGVAGERVEKGVVARHEFVAAVVVEISGKQQATVELAEIDLEQRGPGEFFGTRQSGLPEFRVASLLRDRETLELAKREAANFAVNAEATEEEKETVRTQLKQHWQRHYGLVEA